MSKPAAKSERRLQPVYEPARMTNMTEREAKIQSILAL